MTKLLICLTLSAIVFSASAQVERPHDNTAAKDQGMHQGMRMQKGHMMMQKLNLTDAQKQQMKTIHMDFKTRMEALEKNDNMLLKDYKAQKKQLMEERKSKIQEILTPEQKAQLANVKQRHMQHGDRSERMGRLKDLGLSKDQVAQLKTRKEETKAKLQTIKNDQSLTGEQKKEQMKALKASARESFKSVLTPEQQQKLEASKPTNQDKPNDNK